MYHSIRLQVGLLAALVIVSVANEGHSQVPDGAMAVADRDHAECQDENRGPDGRVDLQGYLRCRDDRDRLHEERKAEEERIRREQAEAVEVEIRAAEERAREARAATAAEAAAQRAEEQARLRAQLEERLQEARMADEERRRRCGKSYMTVAVGMPFDRFVACNGEAAPIGQVEYKGSVVSVYVTEFWRVVVRDERIVAWESR